MDSLTHICFKNVRRRLEQILKTLAEYPVPEIVRTIRAIMALERIGSPEAQAVLVALTRRSPAWTGRVNFASRRTLLG
jgi:hypothetical protein